MIATPGMTVDSSAKSVEKAHCYKCNRWHPSDKLRAFKDSVGRTRLICLRCYSCRRQYTG